MSAGLMPSFVTELLSSQCKYKVNSVSLLLHITGPYCPATGWSGEGEGEGVKEGHLRSLSIYLSSIEERNGVIL